MTNYPQELAQDAVCHSHTGHMTGLWFLPARPLSLNTDEWMNECKYNFSICVCVRFLFVSDLRQDIQRYEAVLSALLTVWRVDTDSKAMCRFEVWNFKHHSKPHVQLILIMLLLFLLLLWRYNSDSLGLLDNTFHLRRSCTCSAHFINFIFFRPFLTSSSHRDLGLPAGLPVNSFHLCILFTMLVSGILFMCPNQLYRCALT